VQSNGSITTIGICSPIALITRVAISPLVAPNWSSRSQTYAVSFRPSAEQIAASWFSNADESRPPEKSSPTLPASPSERRMAERVSPTRDRDSAARSNRSSGGLEYSSPTQGETGGNSASMNGVTKLRTSPRNEIAGRLGRRSNGSIASAPSPTRRNGDLWSN
jgi:hypothetical protein